MKVNLLVRTVLKRIRSSHRRSYVKKDVLKNFANFTGKHLCWNLFLIKLQAFRKKRLQHKYFSANFAKFLRTSVSEIWLFLNSIKTPMKNNLFQTNNQLPSNCTYVGTKYYVADLKTCRRSKQSKVQNKNVGNFTTSEKNHPSDIYLLKVNNRNTRTSCSIYSKLTIKTPEGRP